MLNAIDYTVDIMVIAKQPGTSVKKQIKQIKAKLLEDCLIPLIVVTAKRHPLFKEIKERVPDHMNMVGLILTMDYHKHFEA